MGSSENGLDGSHSAADAAMGFYYQSLYGLLRIVSAPDDDAAICLERLDDIEILANGQSLLAQLKHSLSTAPPPVTISSVALWKTLKAWIDVLPKLSLNETQFQLVTVAPLPIGSPLEPLRDLSTPRDELLGLLEIEAQRVVDEHDAAKIVGKSPFPHAQRVLCCAAFLNLQSNARRNLLSRITILPSATNIENISEEIAKRLSNFPPSRRNAITQRLMEWWDLQVVHSFCGKRVRVISMLEVQQQIIEIAGQLERDEILADFEFKAMPEGHTPPSMIARQLQLVRCTKTEIQAAEREEWRARSQRHKWMSERVDMAVRIDQYDQMLIEEWAYKHGIAVEQHAASSADDKCSAGLGIFRWSFEQAHRHVSPFAPNWNASYYVRGCYQVLAVELSVGWHPDFRDLLLEKP
ncbi:Uncharacterised protein [Achromobacter insolitus]|nr:hypothetical protein CEY08_08760 [Achromobacter insolitus]CAB3652729.1 hypothetical protein LMG6003_00142 [Achromobacter insolitus]VEG66074.1 Uncharacterised protein [Achromobacter insolitus]